MTQPKLYKRYRFPPEIIQYAVWLYHRFNLSHRDIEDLMSQRGIEVSYESIRLWCNKFGPRYAQRLRRKHQGYGDTFFIDEVFVKIQGERHYLWRAVDQDGEVVDVLLQKRRDGKAAKRFFKRLSHEPTRLRERGMRKFKSMEQAQRFLDVHAAVYNVFNLSRHLVSAENYRFFRQRAFASWESGLFIINGGHRHSLK
jgi:putative transposase